MHASNHRALTLGFYAAFMAGFALLGAHAPAAAQSADLLAGPHDTYPGGVAGFKDVTYQVIPGYHSQTADIYVPTSGKGPFPAVVYVHGGGWVVGSPRDGDTVDMLTGLAARGYVVMGINYRFSGEAKFPAQIQDTKASIRWLRSNAATYGVDTAKVGIWGGSAGGHLAALAGTSCGVKELAPPAVAAGRVFPGQKQIKVDAAQSDCVQAVADWFGPIDFMTMDSQSLPGSPRHDSPGSAETGLLGCQLSKCSKELLAQSNPATYIDKSDPPFLIMHGADDRAVPPRQSEELSKALAAKGVAAKLVVVPGAGHGFAGFDEPKLHELWQTVYDFFGTTLGR